MQKDISAVTAENIEQSKWLQSHPETGTFEKQSASYEKSSNGALLDASCALGNVIP